MLDTLSLFLQCLICVLLSLIILRVLSGPLTGLLERLCPDSASAAFWRCYAQVMLVLAPLLCVMLVDLIAPNSDPGSRFRLGTIASLGGLLLGLWIVGRRLGHFIEAERAPGGRP